MKSLILIIAALALGTSCGPFRRAKAPVPPPTRPVPARIPEVANTEKAPPPRNLPAPPAIPTPEVESTAVVGIPTTPNAPPRKEPAVARRRSPVTATPQGEGSEKPLEAPGPAPPWRLGELVTPAQREALQRETEAMLSVCYKAIAAAEGRRLTVQQTETANRIRVFVQQSKESAEMDLTEARNLAARGKAFADALLSEMR